MRTFGAASSGARFPWQNRAFEQFEPALPHICRLTVLAAFDDITRDGQVRTLRGQQPSDWPNSFRGSRLIPAVEYIRAQRARTLLIERFEKFMADWDVVVIPSNALLTTTNLTGNPQVVVKSGFINGSPRSIGFLGKIYDEGSPLRLALAYEQAAEWRAKHPTLVS